VSDARVGAGLIGLTARVAAAGGTLVFGNAPGSGFQIIATMPASVEHASPGTADPLPAVEVTVAPEPMGAATASPVTTEATA